MSKDNLYSEDYWQDLISRYFEAETTPEEETSLKQFLLSEEGRASKYDEVRAVMGFLATGRKESVSKTHVYTNKFTFIKISALAACLITGFFLIGQFLISSYAPKDICLAYVDGRSITEREEVLQLMKKSMDNVVSEETIEDEMFNQLSDMFDTPTR